MAGQIIDASIVLVPTQRNSRDENAELQARRRPAGWKQKLAKVRQKDRDARWTKKHGRSFFGYKNHVNADAKHKLIRHYAVTDAAVHDSQELDGLSDKGNTCNDVFADSAYRSAEIEAELRASGYNSRIRSTRFGAIIRCLQRRMRSEPRQEPDTRSHRACVRSASRLRRAVRIVRTIGIVRSARQDRLAEPGLQHPQPGDAGTARRGMKTLESFLQLFQPQQRAEKRSPEDNRTTRPNPNLCPRTFFEVPFRSMRANRSTWTKEAPVAIRIGFERRSKMISRQRRRNSS